jgi:hypothetical protein
MSIYEGQYTAKIVEFVSQSGFWYSFLSEKGYSRTHLTYPRIFSETKTAAQLSKLYLKSFSLRCERRWMMSMPAGV